ncbi:MAG: rhodanese-like domain-containing protein [Pseudomonadota bacterium]
MSTSNELRELRQRAAARASSLNLPYAGALSPAEAYAFWQATSEARLVDVRTRAEWDWVGRIQNALEIEWLRYPSNERNPDFLAQLQAQVDPSAPVLFLCRSGARSHQAALLAQAAGYQQCFNVLEGFEGDKDNSAEGSGLGQRGKLNGWRHAGLPWYS